MSNNNPIKDNIPEDEALDEEVLELMKNHDLDQDEAEHVQRIIKEYELDENEAVELVQDL